MRDTLVAMRIVADFLSGLSDEELRALALNKAWLRIETAESSGEQPAAKKSPARPPAAKSEMDTDGIVAELRAMTEVKQVTDFLYDQGFTVSALKQIAMAIGLKTLSKDKKGDVINKIANRLVGAKLKYEALESIDPNG